MESLIETMKLGAFYLAAMLGMLYGVRGILAVINRDIPATVAGLVFFGVSAGLLIMGPSGSASISLLYYLMAGISLMVSWFHKSPPAIRPWEIDSQRVIALVSAIGYAVIGYSIDAGPITVLTTVLAVAVVAVPLLLTLVRSRYVTSLQAMIAYRGYCGDPMSMTFLPESNTYKMIDSFRNKNLRFFYHLQREYFVLQLLFVLYGLLLVIL